MPKPAAAPDPHPVPAPTVDAGRYPAKRTVGDLVEVEADVFRDGHDKLRAVDRPRRRRRRAGGASPSCTRSTRITTASAGRAASSSTRRGAGSWTIEAWTDHFATWRDELRRKLEAGQHDLSGELSEGVLLLEDAAGRAKGADRKLIEHALRVLRDDEILEAAKHDAALGHELYAAIERNAERHDATRLEPGARARGRPRARAVRRLVRGVPAVLGRAGGRPRAGPASSPSSASTWST